MGNRTTSSTCPLTDQTTQIYTPAADFNASGSVNVTDALLIAQCSVFVPNGLLRIVLLNRLDKIVAE